MKTPHPTPEDWMSFLYAESAPDRHAALDEHLATCIECQSRVGTWRRTMLELDSSTEADLEPSPRRVVPRRRVTALLAAAAVLVFCGIALGRWFQPAPASADQLQAALRSYVDGQVGTAKAELAQVLSQRQAELAEALRTAAASTASEEARTILAQYAQALEDQRQADRQAYLAAFHQLDEERRTDVGHLREQLETVAVNADDGLSQTREQLLNLTAVGPVQP